MPLRVVSAPSLQPLLGAVLWRDVLFGEYYENKSIDDCISVYCNLEMFEAAHAVGALLWLRTRASQQFKAVKSRFQDQEYLHPQEA